VALEREQRVVALHADAVVADADRQAPALLDRDVDRRGARVERVLDQLLHRRRGALDHLAGGDLVSHGRWEHCDARHGEGYRTGANPVNRAGCTGSIGMRALAGTHPARPASTVR
jgi:hypothetical protein